MAFFGITYLGYQRPIGDRMLSSGQNKSDVGDAFRSSMLRGLPPISSNRGLTYADPCSMRSDSHQSQYRTIRRVYMPRSPKELYRVPLTDNQQYGWWIPTGSSKNQESWTQIRRFPRKNSEMTKFVNEMSMTDANFSLF